MSNLPLPQFFAQTLTRVAPIIDDTLSSSDPSVQSTLSSALNDLHLIGRMMTSLGVFSENEGVDEIGDGELRFMSLGWVVGECEGKLGLQGRDDRMKALKRSEVSQLLFEGNELIAGGIWTVLGPVDFLWGLDRGGEAGK
jgi:immunoglobulin-binding protein 1